MRLRKVRGRVVGLVFLVAVAVPAAWALVARPSGDPDQLWREAEADLKAGRFRRAEAALARSARLRTPTPLDWMLRAQVAMALGKTDEALGDLGRVPDGHPMAPQARLQSGQLELRRYQMRRAEAMLLAALALDPKLVQAHRELIYLYGVQSRRVELSAQFRALSELVPLSFANVFHWCLLRNVNWEASELANALTRFIRTDPGDRWSRLALVESRLLQGRVDEAEAVLAPLPDSDPEARAARVRIALERGDDQAAEVLLSGGPADHPVLARLRGRLALARHDGPGALRNFRIAYDAEPDDHDRDTLSGLASALTMIGETAAAAPYLKAARAIDALGSLMQRAAAPGSPENVTLIRQLGAACEAVHRLHEARAWHTLIIQRNPLDTEAQHDLFRINAAIAQADKAH